MRNAAPLVLLSTACLLVGCGDDDGGSGGSGNSGSGGDSSGGSASGGNASGGASTGGSAMGGSSGGPIGGAGGAGSLPDGSDCTTNEQCESGLCYPFSNGSKCTIECPPNPDDCPAGEGCNNMSPAVCKV